MLEAPDARSLRGLKAVSKRRSSGGGTGGAEEGPRGESGRGRQQSRRLLPAPTSLPPAQDLAPRGRVWLTAPLPAGHDARLSVAKGCPFVDGAASYEVVPLAVAADVASRPRADGIQYRVGLHQVWASAEDDGAEEGDDDGKGRMLRGFGRRRSSSSRPSALLPPTTHLQGAVAVEGEATLWRAPPPRRRGWRAKNAAAAAAAAAAEAAAAAVEAAVAADAAAADTSVAGAGAEKGKEEEKAATAAAEEKRDENSSPSSSSSPPSSSSAPLLSLSSLSAKKSTFIRATAATSRDDEEDDEDDDDDADEADSRAAAVAVSSSSASSSDATSPSIWPRYAPFGSPPRLRQPPLPGGRLEAAERRQRRQLKASGVAVAASASSDDDGEGDDGKEGNSCSSGSDDPLASLVGADFVIDLGADGSAPVASSPSKRKKQKEAAAATRATPPTIPFSAADVEARVRSAASAATAARSLTGRLRRAMRAAAAARVPPLDDDGGGARTTPYAPGVGQPGARLFGAVGCLARIPLPGALFAVGRGGGGAGGRARASSAPDSASALASAAAEEAQRRRRPASGRPPLSPSQQQHDAVGACATASSASPSSSPRGGERGATTSLSAPSPPRRVAAAAASLLRAPVATATAAAAAAAAALDGDAWTPYLRHTALRAFGSVGAALQLGRFIRPVLDYTHLSARLDLGLTSAGTGENENGGAIGGIGGFASHGALSGLVGGQNSSSSSDPSSAPPPALLHGGRSHPLHGRGTWHALSVSAVQQVAGPLRVRADARFALEAVPADAGCLGGDGVGGGLLLPPLSPLRRPATPVRYNSRPSSSTGGYGGRRGGGGVFGFGSSNGGGGGGNSPGFNWRSLGGGAAGALASAASTAADAARRIRPARLETVFGADYVLPGTEGTLRLCGWWSPARREAMCELRLL